MKRGRRERERKRNCSEFRSHSVRRVIVARSRTIKKRSRHVSGSIGGSRSKRGLSRDARVVRGQFSVVERTESLTAPPATRKLDAGRRVDSSPSVARSNAGVRGKRRDASVPDNPRGPRRRAATGAYTQLLHANPRSSFLSFLPSRRAFHSSSYSFNKPSSLIPPSRAKNRFYRNYTLLVSQ